MDEADRWRRSVAAWERWADPLAAMADRLNQPLLDAAAVAEGRAVLDLACGVGEPALSATKRVGARGRVIGLDFVPGMVAVAARRAAARSLGNATFIAGDMMALPFAAATFDCVTCRFGLMFVPAPAQALTEIARVLRPGGRVAVMVWGPKADNALFEVLDDSVTAVLGSPGPGTASLDALFRFSASGSVAAALAEAGFGQVAERALTPVRKEPEGSPFWQATLDMVLEVRLADADPEKRRRLEVEIEARFAARADTGIVTLPLHARIGTGFLD